MNRTKPCFIEIRNPLPEFAEVMVLTADGNEILEKVTLAPSEVKEVRVPGPAEYDLRVRLMRVGVQGGVSGEELRPASFSVVQHVDLPDGGKKTPVPALEPVNIRSMADMFREMEEKEAAAS